MNSYQFTPEAAGDLLEIWCYIAEDDSDVADRVEHAIHTAAALLAENPLLGSIRRDLTPLPVRFWLVQPYRKYWMIYNPEFKPLQIIRILHAARDVVPLLK